ncbi:site-specific integrase [Spirillospora sp. NPDC047279]|uniref:site-specific integrase n=1 Tax=Spirillospora sp. NPDC047279 TaxID=3155478 RepID=UPI0033CA1F23
MRAALNQAIRERRIDINVASLVELPPGRRPKVLVWTPDRSAEWRRAYAAHVATMERRRQQLSQREPGNRHGTRINRLDAYIGAPRPSPVMVWTPDQTWTFLERARRHRLFTLYYLIAFRGLRRGEACGLRRPDLDLDEGTVSVRWQITQLGGSTDQGRPKSEAGERQVSLDNETVNVLRAHRTKQTHPAYVTEQFELLAMEAGLPPIRLHDLRHGAATILLAAGYDMKVVQETLGLSSITIAADTYTSVLPDLARRSAEDPLCQAQVRQKGMKFPN